MNWRFAVDVLIWTFGVAALTVCTYGLILGVSRAGW